MPAVVVMNVSGSVDRAVVMMRRPRKRSGAAGPNESQAGHRNHTTIYKTHQIILLVGLYSSAFSPEAIFGRMQIKAGPQHVCFLQERRRFRARACPISPDAFPQFMQARSVNFADGEKRGIFLLLSRALRSKMHNWSCKIPARESRQAPRKAEREKHDLQGGSEKICRREEQSRRCRK